jgi:hypothetical protein
MWFSQYGRAWSGPWFLVGETTLVFCSAGIMLIIDLPAAMLTTEDRAYGRIDVADR